MSYFLQTFNLANIDLGIIIIYLIFVVLLGLYFGKRHENAEDYFLAGRSLTWPLIGFSLFASNMSSNSLVGLAGSGYQDGFSVYSYEWMAVLILIIFAIFFLPFYLKNRIFTIPEYLQNRYSYSVRAYASGIAIILNILVDISATLYAGGLVINIIFPQFALGTIILGLAIVAGIYTISGGLSAVVYTDAVQAVILIFGSALITIFAFNKIGGWEPVYAITDPGHFKIIKPADDDVLPWPALISGVLLIGFYFWGTNQYITQRTLAAKNVQQGQWGALFAGLLKLSILFVMIFPGAFARVIYPFAGYDDQNNVLVTAMDGSTMGLDSIYPSMLFDLLPTGVLGVVLAGLIAAMMSSLDSGLNSVSTLITMDFYTKWKPKASPRQLMGIGRIITIIVMVLAVLWAPRIGNFPKLWDYLQQTLAWFSPPVVALFVMGLFSKRTNEKGALASIAVGLMLTVLLILNEGFDGFPLPNFLYVAGFHFLVCCSVLYIVSAITKPPLDNQIETTVWTPSVFRAETRVLKALPWYKNYRYQALILLFGLLYILLYYG
ncbi:MAG TPA: sodium:solute symporter [Saprospiraceae bacterium]|nr:sodium:solute symporter [Saprospiraceae bacterium]